MSQRRPIQPSSSNTQSQLTPLNFRHEPQLVVYSSFGHFWGALSLSQACSIVAHCPIGVVSLFSLIVLGLSAHLIAVTESDFTIPFYYVFAALALATSLLTILTMPTMLAIDMLRKGAFTSMIIVEVAWLGVLGILWLATAALASDNWSNRSLSCAFNYDIIIQGCRETQAIQAFAHLNWLWLLSYVTGLIVLSVSSQNNGRDVWRSSVKDAVTSSTTNMTGTQSYPSNPAKLAAMGNPMQQTPVMQQAYPPQGHVSPQGAGYAPSPQSPGSPCVPSHGQV